MPYGPPLRLSIPTSAMVRASNYRDRTRRVEVTSGKLHVLFLPFLLERPQKSKTYVRKNLPSWLVNNLYA
jgi:hypothetical protein